MPWLNHPSYVPIRQSLLEDLRRAIPFFKRPPAVVFLCGGKESLRRARVKQLLEQRPSTFVFLAEDVWREVAALATDEKNLLEIEAFLAKLADAVIIIVESPGTIAELGAFAISDPLRAKLIPILSEEFQSERSFINDGPVRSVDRDSTFKPCIFTKLDPILACSLDLSERLQRIPKPWGRGLSLVDLGESGKEQLFFIADLVGIIGPASAEQITYYVRALLGEAPTTELKALLALGVATKLISKQNIAVGPLRQQGNRIALYYSLLGVQAIGSFPGTGTRHPIDFSRHRARVLSFLQRHPPAARALEAIWGWTQHAS